MTYPPPPAGAGQPPPPGPGQPWQPGPGQPPPGPGQPWQPGPPPYPAAPRKRGRGCLIGVIVAIVALVVLCGAGGYAVYRLVDEAKDVVPGLGDTTCPSADRVSDIVGYDVAKVTDADIVVAAGCNYSGSGVGVTITKGSSVIADEEIDSFRTEARNAGTEAEPIDAGDEGLAFGTPRRSQAITKSDGVVEVEIFAEGTQDIGDREDAAVELLETFLDLQ